MESILIFMWILMVVAAFCLGRSLGYREALQLIENGVLSAVQAVLNSITKNIKQNIDDDNSQCGDC